MPDIPEGLWPVMLTPFRDDGSLDWEGVDKLVDWYIAAGAAGLFAVALSGEMYELEPWERLALAERVVRRADGRVPVVASGTFAGEPQEQARFVSSMGSTGVAAVVVLTCQVAAEPESDDTWRANVQRLLDRSGDVPLGLYECPVPYKRLLSPELLRWCADSGRFFFLKDTSCHVADLQAKLAAVRGTGLRLFNASTPTLLASLQAGAAGFSGIGANFHPALYAWLCANWRAQPERAMHLQRFLSIADRVVGHKYQASAKRFAAMQGVSIAPYCRVGNPEFDDEDLFTLQHLLEYEREAFPDELGPAAEA
jgi:4-hydroxy-tetrahydrodipicolinate synthase